MNDLMITTMPIKPYKKINIGLMIAPTLCDVLGSILNCKKVLAFNLLHSFEDKNIELKKYTDNIENFNIKHNEIIKDIENIEKYLKKIEELYKIGIISIQKGEILRCECNKVEMLKSSVKYNKNGELYYLKDGKIICKFCEKECKKYTQSNLLLDIKEETLKQILIKDFAEKYNTKQNKVKKITQKIKSKK